MFFLVALLISCRIILSNESLIDEKFKEITDRHFRCKQLSQPGVVSNIDAEILQTVDCDHPNARLDFKIKKFESDTDCKTKYPLDGACSVSFSKSAKASDLKSAIRFGRCFAPYKKEVLQISGHFKNNELQGYVVVEFVDGTRELREARNNRFVGVSRFFDDQWNLVNASLFDHFLLRAYEHGFYIDFHEHERIFLRRLSSDVLVCRFGKSLNLFRECFSLVYSDKIFKIDGCNIESKLSSFTEQKLSDESKKLKYNMVSDEIIEERAHQSLCSLDHQWSSENIKDKFVSWRSRLYLDPNPTWFDSEITQPLNPKLPTVNVSVRHFANRKDMSKTVFKITNMRGDILLSGLAKNGVIFSDVPGEVASRSDWYDPVTITFSQYKAGYDTFNEEHDAAFFSVHGRLKDGKLQGFVVFKGTLSVDPFGHCPSTIFVGNGFVGKYNDGIPTGVCYLGLVGAAWVYGRVDDSGHFTGDDIAYIYPDMKTAFIGTFKKGIMISATETEVEAVRCPSTGILEVKFSPANKSPVYKYSPPNSKSFGDDPLKDDPLDNRYLYLKKSMAGVNAGEGMFAKVDIPEGTTIGVMSGLLFKEKYLAQPLAKSDEAIQSPNEFLNTSSGYRLDLIDCKVHIDIPPEYRSTENFRATLGHKINHSFEPNVKFTPMESPRFGVIISVYAIKNITKDEEILVNYKYKIDNAPVWYKQLHEEHLKNISSETSTVHN